MTLPVQRGGHHRGGSPRARGGVGRIEAEVGAGSTAAWAPGTVPGPEAKRRLPSSTNAGPFFFPGGGGFTTGKEIFYVG